MKMQKIEEKQGENIVIEMVWMHYKIYPASMEPYYNWSDSDAWT